MSAEILGGWLIKLAWSPFLAWFWYITKREDKRREEQDKSIADKFKDTDDRFKDTYDKAAVDTMFEHNKLMNEQRQTFTEQRLANLEIMFTGFMSKIEERDERIFTNFSDIKSQIAIITTTIDKRKDDK